MEIKKQVSDMKHNIAGAVIGGVAVFFAAKKFGKVENKWALAGLTLVGVIAGVVIEAKIKAKKGVPTAATIKK